MHTFFLFSALFSVLLVTSGTPINPSVVWKRDWSGELPSGGTGMHRGWVGYGSDQDGGKFVENRWQNSWHSRNGGGDSIWNKKQTLDDNWDVSDTGKWSWNNGGSHGWGTWGNGIGKHAKNRQCCPDIGFGQDWNGRENGYTFWGNTNMDSWKNSGGGEGWRKLEVDGDGLGKEGHERGGWKRWKSGSGGGNWDSWKSSDKPINAKAEAYASASVDP